MISQPKHQSKQSPLAESLRRSGMVVAVAVAVDKCSRSSRDALRWAIDHVEAQPQCAVKIMLVHVHLITNTSTTSPWLQPLPPPYMSNELAIRREPDERLMELMKPYICFCLIRQVECELVVLQHVDVADALKEFISFYGVQNFVIGQGQRRWTSRIFRGAADVETMLQSYIPSFCNVYAIDQNPRRRNSHFHARPFRLLPRRVVADETISSEHVASDREWSVAQSSVPVSPPSISAPTSAAISRMSSTTTQPDELYFHGVQFSFIQAERFSTDSSFISFYKSLGIKSHFKNMNLL